ncbi:Gfo/Idh/MocA family oxidoreductase [Spirosoma endophyticum]|uniref:Predicted dehydrogenase n=1 Tax=Spirosoma endophyticum TaxID=662367 RepID=A0A1I1HXP8_9BACT|nr:Gfo/Idh/MocA family oxidoreductase [Spirosoma endophyticum]SFC28867.1 Predicted dehydrogenase [Spirosoma endophyticum]
MSKVLNVGLVGFGLSGRYFHTPFLSVNPKFRLKKIASSRPDAVRAFDPSIEWVATPAELFEDPTIDLVFICSPNETHVDYARQALEQGKHVVVEKPFALSETGAVELLELAQKQGCIATAYQNRRWDSDFLTIKRLLADGSLGTLVEYEGRYDRYAPVPPDSQSWKELPGIGRGNLYNLGPHMLDQALNLFGRPDTVEATIRIIRPNSRVTDYFDIKLGYADKVVRVESNYMVYHNQPRYRLNGTEGSFIKGGLDVQEERQRLNQLPNLPDWGVEPPDRWGTLYRDGQSILIESERGNYTPFYDNLYDAIVNGAEPAITPTDIQQLARVIDLAMESSQTLRTISF